MNKFKIYYTSYNGGIKYHEEIIEAENLDEAHKIAEEKFNELWVEKIIEI